MIILRLIFRVIMVFYLTFLALNLKDFFNKSNYREGLNKGIGLHIVH